MFGTILIAICTVMHVYLFWRAASVPLIESHVSKRALIATAVLLWLLLYLGRVLGHDGAGISAAVLEFAGMTWMAALFLTFLSVLAIDIVTAFGFLLPKSAPSLRGWAMAVGVVLSVIALFQGLRSPVVTTYEVKLSGLPEKLDGTVIAAVSDTHLGNMLGARWLAARVAQVKMLDPDLVVLLGDIFEGHRYPSKQETAMLKSISAPLGVWAVPGNHEFHGGGGLGLFADADLTLLRNRWADPAPGFVLAGVNDFTAARRNGNGEDFIHRALAGKPSGAVVLLSHTPWHTKTAAGAGVDLMLSGHTHGGQIWPFGYLVRTRYPLVSGRYEVDGMTVIVCRGTGTWGPRMRLWRPGEILRVTLRSGKEDSRAESRWR